MHGGGYIYDCRGLINPGKKSEFRNLTGLDKAVAEFMETDPGLKGFIDDAYSMVERSVTSYKKKNYTSLAVSFGCTGGRHRSVYCTERFAEKLRQIEGIDIEIIHQGYRLEYEGNDTCSRFWHKARRAYPSQPKILMDINGKTVLELILEKFKLYGFDDIIINVHYLADMIEEEGARLAKELVLNISFSDERDALLDTGGGVYKAREFFGNDPFLLYNGDILTDMNLKALFDYHVRKKAMATVATRNRPGNRFFLTDKEGRIRGWTNRKTGMDIVTIDEPMELQEIASTAITVLSAEIFEYMKEGVYSMTSILLDIAGKELVTTFKYDAGYWIDVGSPEMLQEARRIIS